MTGCSWSSTAPQTLPPTLHTMPPSIKCLQQETHTLFLIRFSDDSSATSSFSGSNYKSRQCDNLNQRSRNPKCRIRVSRLEPTKHGCILHKSLWLPNETHWNPTHTSRMWLALFWRIRIRTRLLEIFWYSSLPWTQRCLVLSSTTLNPADLILIHMILSVSLLTTVNT